MPLRRVRLPLVLAALCLVLGWSLAGQSPRPRPAIIVSIAPGTTNVPVDGRLLVIVSTRKEGEPRFQVSDAVNTEQVFGVDVENAAPGGEIAIDASALGYPMERLADVPAGRYTVQAVLHLYETFRRADGHTVKLPMDRGEGQQWNRAPGNLLSTPQLVSFDPAATTPARLVLDHAIPPIPDPPETKYIRRDSPLRKDVTP